MAPKRILVVDDEDSIREIAALSLQAVGGYDVVTADSGADCLQQAAAHQPDAILLDVMMPDMDGPTTFRTLQSDARTKEIPVVLLTAKVQASDHRRFAELGVAAVLAKPFDPIALPHQVADVLGWPG
jgi:CheY-like chemotaxis protein